MQKGQEFSSFKELEPALNELRMCTTILSKFSTVKLFEIRTEDTRSLRVFWNQLMRSGSTPTWVTGRNKLCVCVCSCVCVSVHSCGMSGWVEEGVVVSSPYRPHVLEVVRWTNLIPGPIAYYVWQGQKRSLIICTQVSTVMFLSKCVAN